MLLSHRFSRVLRGAPALALTLAGCAVLAPTGALAHGGCAHRSSYRAGEGTGGSTHRRCAASHRPHHAQAACANTNLHPTPANLSLIRSAVFCLVNRERARHGEHALRPNMRLRRAAQAHSESMAQGGYFNHVSPGGATPLARMRSVGYISNAAGYEVGENIAYGTLWLATPRAIVAAWMASPGHRANILDGRFRDTAIGISTHLSRSLSAGQPGAMYTQDFGVKFGR
jgi:uncharacterized protein YkwD